MKQNIQLIIAFLLIANTSTFAQKAPGYMGKRLSVGGSGQFMSAFRGPNKNGESGFISFNDQYSIDLEYATQRKASLKFSYGFFKTQKDYKKLIENDFNGDYEIPYNVKTELNVQTISLEYRMFRTSIAPYGRYLGVFANYKSIQLNQDKYFETLEISKRLQYDNPITLLSIGISFGKQRIFFDRIVVDYGISAMLPLSLGKLPLPLLKVNRSNVKDHENEYSVQRAVFHDYFNFKFGLRYLLF